MYPKSFTNKIKKEKLNFIEIPSNYNSVDDIKQWANEYGSLTNTHWIARSSIRALIKMLCS